MNEKLVIALKVPSFFFLIFRMYLKFRRARNVYLRKFRTTLDATQLEMNARTKIYAIEKELIGNGFSDILGSLRM